MSLEYLESLASEEKNGSHVVPGDRMAVEREVGRVLYDLVKEKKPQTVVEIGTARGYSGAWIGLALTENGSGMLVTFDRTQAPAYYWETFSPPPQIVRIHGSPDAASLPERIDFAFLDGSHLVEDVERDANLVIGRIPDGGIIAIHDILLVGTMGAYMRQYFAKLPDWTYREFKSWCGLGIAEKGKR